MKYFIFHIPTELECIVKLNSGKKIPCFMVWLPDKVDFIPIDRANPIARENPIDMENLQLSDSERDIKVRLKLSLFQSLKLCKFQESDRHCVRAGPCQVQLADVGLGRWLSFRTCILTKIELRKIWRIVTKRTKINKPNRQDRVLRVGWLIGLNHMINFPDHEFHV